MHHPRVYPHIRLIIADFVNVALFLQVVKQKRTLQQGSMVRLTMTYDINITGRRRYKLMTDR